MSDTEQEALVAESEHGLRFDQAAAELFPEYSRARLQQWIRDESLLLNDAPARPKDRVHSGDRLSLCAVQEEESDWQPTEMGLDILFEDEHLLVVNKPVGLVVHPAAGHSDDTLVNGLLAYCPPLAAMPRAGIVHRLDKDTSGLLVVAKTLEAHKVLVDDLQAREIRREYQALVQGVLVSGGTVDEPIGRHPRNRQKMAVRTTGGKHAITHYRVIERFRAHSLLRVVLETGRTHQIRVHMAHLGYPIVGDPSYGGRRRRPPGASEDLLACLQAFRRQALHAWRLGLCHPLSGDDMRWEAPLPADMTELLDLLRRDRDLSES